MNIPRMFRFALITLCLVFGLVSPLAATASVAYDDDPGSSVRISDLAAAYRLFDQVFNLEDADAAAALVSDDAVIDTQFGEYTGSEGLLTYIANVKHTYPGATFSLTRVSLSDDGVTVNWLLTGTKIRMSGSDEMTSVDVQLRGSTAIAMDDQQIAAITSTSSGPM